MRKSFFTELDQKEFDLLCDFMNGKVVDFTGVFWRQNFMSDLEDSSNRKMFKKWKVKKEDLLKTLKIFTNVEFIELIMSIDEFWGDNEEKYHVLDMQCPPSKIQEICCGLEILEPMCWNPDEETAEEFIGNSLKMGYDLLIKLLDLEKISKSLWAIKEEDMMGFMLSVANEKFFARIQRNDGSIKLECI